MDVVVRVSKKPAEFAHESRKAPRRTERRHDRTSSSPRARSSLHAAQHGRQPLAPVPRGVDSVERLKMGDETGDETFQSELGFVKSLIGNLKDLGARRRTRLGGAGPRAHEGTISFGRV